LKKLIKNMADFQKLVVNDIYKETKDTVAVTFDVPKQLQEKFQYKQGQYLNLKKDINGEDIRRSYSLCSSPIDNKWQVAIKKIKGGVFSTYANEELKIGDVLEVSIPDGKFFVEVDANKPKHYIVFAAGSGITPILSIIKTHLSLEPNATVQLFYLNRKVKSIIFKDEIEGLKNKFLGRFEVFHFLTKESRGIPLLNGRFTSEKLQELVAKVIEVASVDECFICGPEEMIFLIRDELTAAGLAKEKVHFELFNAGNTEESKKHIAEVLEHQADKTEVTIIDGDKEFHFEMDVADHDNILDAALANDADLPFACKGGVCCTCRAKVIEGEVEMKLNYGLEPDEVEAGYVLTCQAVPVTDKVVVDFDA
jgi:ring-1,2-phenylacetyl-CoA epoxidase subunit PaaE